MESAEAAVDRALAEGKIPKSQAAEGDWVCVDLVPVRALERPVGLDTIKADKVLKEMPLIRQSRLSVMPLTEAQSSRLLELGETKV